METHRKTLKRLLQLVMVLQNILRKKSPLRYAPASRFESEDIESGRIILGK